MNWFQVYIEDVEKDAKALKASKQAQTKKCLERIQIVQKDLQESVSEVIAQYISKQYKSNYNYEWIEYWILFYKNILILRLIVQEEHILKKKVVP